MGKTKKLLSILLLFLVSLTAVAATVASNVSVTTDIDGSNINHGTSLTGTLTFTNSDTVNRTLDISASSLDPELTFGTISQITVTNGSTNTASYMVSVAQYTSAGTYSYTITYADSSNSSDTASDTYSLVVPSDNTLSKTIDDDERTTRSSTKDFILSLTNNGNTNGSVTNISFPTLELNWNNEVNLTPSGNNADITLSSNTTGNKTFTYTTDAETEYGIYTGTLNYIDESGSSQSQTITLRVYEDSYDSRIEIDADLEDITNDDGDTYPGDIIRIEDVEIKNEYTNNNDDSITDIELEYRVYYAADGDDIIEETYSETFELEEDEETNNFDIDFQIPFDANEGNYIVELVVTGEISSDGSDDGDEISNRLYFNFNVDKESRHMIPKDLLTNSYCPGETAELRIELVNIGLNDLDEDDDMMVRVKIPSFDYDQWHNYTEDIDSGDIETILLNVDIPSSVATGDHEIKIYSRHDGNSNSNKDGSLLTEMLTLSSTCAGTASSETTTLSGQSSEEGAHGMNTKYTLTVTNNGDSAVTYQVEVIGADAWGAAVVSPETLSVPAGETSSFNVYLQPGENAQSTNNAVVNLKSGGEVVASKTLTMTISGMSISTLTDALFGDKLSELGNTNMVTMLSLLLVLGTAGGAIWLVHGKEIKKRASKKKKKTKKTKKTKSKNKKQK